MSLSASAAASQVLKNTRGAHPTLRLDGFLKKTDQGYQHAEAQTQGDRFVRKMATYGQVRPSVSFTNEARAQRTFKESQAIDTSNLPAPWSDPRGEPKELCFEYPLPPTDIDDSHFAMVRNQSLMLPSERFREHLAMREGEKKWRQDRKDAFMYKKRMLKIEREYQQGIVGVDGPLFPGTKLYEQPRSFLEAQAEVKGGKAEGRFQHLAHQHRADDATAQRNFGMPHDLPRSHDIGIQRKCVNADKHPYRFLDTHDRLFPTYVPVWDPERAAALRSHDVRGKKHNHLNQADNHMEHRVAPNWEEEAKKNLQMKIAMHARPTSPEMV
jgi:hypothetical protein